MGRWDDVARDMPVGSAACGESSRPWLVVELELPTRGSRHSATLLWMGNDGRITDHWDGLEGMIRLSQYITSAPEDPDGGE